MVPYGELTRQPARLIMKTAPATNFADAVASHLARRTIVDLYTVIRSGESLCIVVGAKVVCPKGEAPQVFGAVGTGAQALCALLPKTEADRWTGVKERVALSGTSVWIYGERILPSIQLVVAGAGHIGRELARIGVTMGWSVTVADDRLDYAAQARYPADVRVLCTPFSKLFDEIHLDSCSALVLVTRGHRHDEELLSRIAGGPPFYVGMIGSRRRVQNVLSKLRQEGVSDTWLNTLYAPIGLPIGAETPSEIALAVAAEVTAVWKGRGQWARQEKKLYYTKP